MTAISFPSISKWAECKKLEKKKKIKLLIFIDSEKCHATLRFSYLIITVFKNTLVLYSSSIRYLFFGATVF